MKVVDTVDTMEVECCRPEAKRISIPAGLLGLERVKDYELVANPAEDPFVWMQSVGEPELAFLLVSPFLVVNDYKLDISPDDTEALGLDDADDALVFNIVTLRGTDAATVNLKGPIVINRFTKIAKQVVLNNAAEYSVRHPIVSA
jgi:flagellar assembly factor FliW